ILPHVIILTVFSPLFNRTSSWTEPRIASPQGEPSAGLGRSKSRSAEPQVNAQEKMPSRIVENSYLFLLLPRRALVKLASAWKCVPRIC
ncbi:hypothetical protein EDD16DRAFT_1623660, partial [Pisolithus croceorrhizus]